MFYVCSKQRPDFIRRHLKNWSESGLPIWLVIEEEDVFEYDAAVCDATDAGELTVPVDIAIIDKPGSGISYARDVAVRHAAEQGYESMVMCDDDLLVQNAGTLIEWVQANPEMAGVGAWSRIYKHFLGLHENTGAHPHRKGMGQQVVAYNVEPVLEVGGFDTRIRVLEDIDLVMMLVAAGYGPWHIHTDVSEVHVGTKGQPGGCAASGNRAEQTRQAVEVLSKKWDGYVFHSTRKGEPHYRVLWKKFYEDHEF